MKRIILTVIIWTVDLVGLPVTYLSGLWLKNVRLALHRMPLSRKILRILGVLPVRHHYYDPVVYPEDLRHPLTDERTIVGLDLNIPEQLDLLKNFKFNSELTELPLDDQGIGGFFYRNRWFESGDAEFLFNMIRHFKPAKIIEIGGGYSTLMVRYAIQKNTEEDPVYSCSHTCIEPYEQPWLETTGANIVRQRVQEIEPQFFQTLDQNDILFIDSSHVVRPQGDVLFEHQELLGVIKSGVVVHMHDIFTPRDYPEQWILNESKLWGEQYLLEAFLSFNTEFKVMASLNYLWHNHREQLLQVCPILAQEPKREPASFWFVRN